MMNPASQKKTMQTIATRSHNTRSIKHYYPTDGLAMAWIPFSGVRM